MANIRIEPQLAVLLDNRPGVLARTCQALAKAKINLRALSVIDTIDHAIVRMVVDRPADAEQVLTKLPATVHRRDVVFIDVPNEVGALATIAERLAEAGINIEYAYCTVSPSQPGGALVLRTSDLEATINALS
ncbi:MAG: amino acid-binding protein [Candidatus Omnitrophica bacterium CG11_big_fil_rev_8_21_14_0_20_63_9]|nr:MAG: amino acid-binding protein [Candidatus Omnitrophica bacterium CG11_big_fil_rev_8_21_14_0_20_63_9]